MRDNSAISKKAYQEGKQFENLFDMYCKRYRIDSVVFPLGMKRAGPKIIPVKTPCDRILIYPEGHVIFVDCKSFGDWAVNLSRSMLTEHQVTTMFRFEERGCPAGYVIWFRGINKIVFFSAGQLYEILQNKGSKSPDEGIDLGTFEDMRPDRLFQEYHGTCF